MKFGTNLENWKSTQSTDVIVACFCLLYTGIPLQMAEERPAGRVVFISGSVFPCRYSSSTKTDRGNALCLLDIFCFESTEGLQSLKMGQTPVPESVRPSDLMQEILYLASKPGRLACVVLVTWHV